jgi:uncharacterized membrane protein
MKFDAKFAKIKFCNILLIQNIIICFFFALIFASHGEILFFSNAQRVGCSSIWMVLLFEEAALSASQKYWMLMRPH